jgi:hypothetical protein
MHEIFGFNRPTRAHPLSLGRPGPHLAPAPGGDAPRDEGLVLAGVGGSSGWVTCCLTGVAGV